MATQVQDHQEEFGLQHEKDTKTIFGFWVYIMSDCLLFASLFATYAVLRNNTFGGPSAAELFDLPFALTETLILLTSSFTAGLALLAAHRNKKKQVLGWLFVTLILGVSFLWLEVSEFKHFFSQGADWSRSGFLSAFFTLVGTHGLHVALGSLWMVILMIQIWGRDLVTATMRRLTLWGLFWHFLDIVWIFIFTIVYLLGVIG